MRVTTLGIYHDQYPVNGTLELAIIPFYMGSADKSDGFSLMYDLNAFAGDIPLGYTCALVNWSWSR